MLTRKRIYSRVLAWLPLFPQEQATRRGWSMVTFEQGHAHLFAAFDTRTGKVYARTEVRKRQTEFIALLPQLDGEIASTIRCIHLVLDNSSVHKGKRVRAWLQAHPRFVCWFLPVHCSWMKKTRTVVQLTPAQADAYQRLH